MNTFHFGHCVIGVALAVVLLVALGVSASSLGILLVALACALMMLVMMRSMMVGSHDDSPARLEEPEEPVDHHKVR